MAAMPIRKLLLIDDDVDDFIIFEEAVKAVDDSLELRYISSVKDVPADGPCAEPDLLFLDINMPERDGFEWLKCIRDRGYTFPIVMYSTASNPAYVERAYTSGANVYFPKPDSIKTLQESLRRLLNLDWNDPKTVTESFFRHGQYRVFRLD